MQCPQCQQDNPPQAKFCLECGTRLGLTCAQCGTELPAGAKFCLACGQPVGTRPVMPSRFATPETYTPKHLAEKILTARSDLAGERKQVTVLFADIKGSLELIADRDPEEARHILDPVLEHLMAAVHRYEGTVNQVMGDGIMALFGAPVAHEDHAVRACYAALAMQAALRRYGEEVRRTHGLAVQSRVGLNSGDVVVRAISNDLHMDYSAIGQTTHLAARMEQLATPGSILLTATTLRLVEGLVQVHALGPIPVKGLAEPVEVFELIGASTVRRRLQAAVARGLTRFVGRQTELDALSHAQERAGAGHGQVVALVGEAGVGKSRLVYEFVHSHRTRAWLVLESASVSYGKATPYFPVIDLLKRYAHVEEHDDTRTIRAKVTGQALTLDETLQDIIPALLALLDALPEESPFLRLDPPQRRQRTLTALKRVLLRESQVQPLLLVFEDLHWIDTETQALLDSLVESLPTAQILLLVNYRPEYQHGWGSKTYYTQLRLDPLPPLSADAFLHALLGDDASLQPLTPLLIARTEGNPFFLEESVRTLVETGVLQGERGAYHLGQALQTIQVPATVQAVLAARIDRLPPEEKGLLQTAAVIGHEVPLPLLQAIADMPEEVLHRSLAHLQATEFLYETRLFPECEYTFKHALTHEVAYGGLLQERRRALHARIVEALEALAGDRLAEQVERLAHHALRGEVWDKALAYCRQAGEKAMVRSAYREAVGYFEQALSALPHLPEQRATREQAIDLRLALRSALWPSGDLGRILAYLREAEALAAALDDPRRLGQVSLFLSHPFLQQWVRMTRPSPLPSAPWRSPRPAGMSSCTRWRTATSAEPTRPRATIVGRSTAQADCGVPRRGAAPRALRPGHPARRAIPCLARLVPCRAGHVRRGPRPRGRRAPDCRGGRSPREASCWPLGESVCWPSAKATCPGRSPWLERAMGICQDADLPVYFPRMAAALGAAYTLAGRVADAVPLLTQAMEQTTATETVVFRRSVASPWGRRTAGWIAWRRRTPSPSVHWHMPVRTRNAATRRMPCASSATLRRGASLRRATQAGDLLPPGPGPGRRTRHAPAPGPLPPGPRHAVCHDRPAGASSRRAIRGHRAVPCHGHDVLAAPDGSGAGAGGGTVRGPMAMPAT